MRGASATRGRGARFGELAAVGAVTATTAVLAATLPGVALMLAPAVLTFVLLLLGFTPGEQLLARMRSRRFMRRRDRAPRVLAVRHVVITRRMPSLATSALAMRPPPFTPARTR